jgi:hypothetical protein
MSKVKMQFDPDLAKEIGVEEAIMYSNIEYWCAHNQANRVNLHEGRYWTYNSISAFTELFTFWTEKQIRRILDNLVKKGHVMVGEFAANKYDRTKWYSVASQTVRLDLPETANGLGEVVKSTYTDNKPNTKPKEGDIEKTTNAEKRFISFRAAYEGGKGGHEVEFQNFKKKHKNWVDVADLLQPALERQKKERDMLAAANEFVPQWPNLQTYINQSRWLFEYKPKNANKNQQAVNRNQSLE